MSVLLVVPVGYVGGAENLFLAIGSRLSAYGVRPTLACMRPGVLPEKAAQLGISAFAFKEHRYRNLVAVWQGIGWLADVARRVGANVIHATHSAHLYAAPAARRVGIPEVWHQHDYPNDRDPLCRLNRRIASGHTIFATNVIKGSFARQLRRPHSVIHPTCVDVMRLRETPIDASVRSRLGLPAGPLFLTIARLQEYKGHRHLIQAAARVLAKHPDTVFAIIGQATDATQKAYVAEIASYTEQLGVQDRVRFLGYVRDADLVNLYRAAAGVVHPAVQEGFSVTLQEAMAMGVPIIAAAADGPRELVARAKTGLLVPVRDVPALADAILSILDDPQLARRMSDEGLQASLDLRLETMVEKTLDVYRQVTRSCMTNVV
jgi:glycosyltransferase involved in cell wall biosynthesis